MTGRIAGRGAVSGLGVLPSLALGALWWWAVVRLAVAPDAGALEGAVAAGGWGLSLLPVHCAAKARAAGAVAQGRWRAAWRGTEGPRGRRERSLRHCGRGESEGECGGGGAEGASEGCAECEGWLEGRR
ncbi:hypothetical protein ABT330_04045 [Streptomyces sp. NPDC000658]|uniref:hypothetical protein n=1 Tax=Streptomyces sp. NPDC000658 TaxID=3154266 RepID=UPI00331FC7E4